MVNRTTMICGSYIALSLLLLTVTLEAKKVGKWRDGSDGEGGEEEEVEYGKTCHDYSGKLIRRLVKEGLTCFSHMKTRHPGEFVQRFYCIIKCAMKKLGLFTQDGQVDQLPLLQFFEENFDPSFAQIILPKVTACMELVKEFNDKDYWCKSYEPLITCGTKVALADYFGYVTKCYTSPLINISMDVLTSITPNVIMPSQDAETRERIRKLKLPKGVKCYNLDCSRRYKLEKFDNGTQVRVTMFDEEMKETSTESRARNLTASIEDEH